MKTYVLDAGAIVRYLTNGAGVEKVDALIDKASKGEVRLLMSTVNWGEALYSLARSVGLGKATSDLKAMSALVESEAVDEALAEASAAIKLHYRLGFPDCFAASLAMRMNATLVTSDPDFAMLGKKLKILALPPHPA